MRVAPDRPDHSENVGIALSQHHPVTAATAATVTLYSADGLIAVQDEHDDVVADVPQVVSNSAGDDDLTSLTWLQDRNLLESVSELPKHEFIDRNVSNFNLSNCSASSSSSHKSSSNQSNNNVPRISYDPQVHVNSKPPFSFSCLIFMAIEDSDDKALPVKDIYIWIQNNFPYYRNAPTGWKNSVRHNLSLNKCFKKVDKSPNLGKGSLWMVEQRFRPCLIQALQKIPYHQYHKFIRNSNSNKSNSRGVASGGSGDDSSRYSDLKFDKMTSEDDDMCDSKSIASTECTARDEYSAASSPVSQAVSMKAYPLTEDIDAAATAMLVLKHGACAFDIKAENVDFFLSENSKVPKVEEESSEGKLSLTSSTNDDHNYGYHQGLARGDSVAEPDTSIDDRLNSSYWKEDLEERRKIVEGADALLNLAGITTYNTRKRSMSTDEQRNVKQSSGTLGESTTEARNTKISRKEKANCKVSISTSNNNRSSNDEYNTDDNDGDGSSNPSKCSSSISSSNVTSHEEKSRRHRTPVTSNRRLRKKVEKKRFKL